MIQPELKLAGRCLFWCVAQEGVLAAVEDDGREQGMGIKSALILNYSRDKNLSPKRSAGDSASSSSLVWTF